MIAKAESGDTIRFAESMSGQSIVLAGNSIRIDKDLNIDARLLEFPVTIDAADLSRVFHCTDDSTVSMNNLVITGGNATTDKKDSYGGGIRSKGTLNLTQVTISGNRAANGGGICVGDMQTLQSQLTMTDCTVSENIAEVGGGIVVLADCVIRSSTIARNVGSLFSGGFSQMSGNTKIINSTIALNQAPNASAVHIGHALRLSMTHVTVANNASNTIVPANALCATMGVELELENCVVAANGSPTAFDIELGSGSKIVPIGANHISRIHWIQPQPLPGVICPVQTKGGICIGGVRISNDDQVTSERDSPIQAAADPGLAPLANYGGLVESMLPLADSPLIDQAISNPSVTASRIMTDTRGFRRATAGHSRGLAKSDIGAVEYRPKHDLTKFATVEATPPSSDNLAKLPRSFIRFDHLFVRNEGNPQSLQSSELMVIPFVTYTSLPTNDSRYQQGQAEWEKILSQHGEKERSGFVLPDWLADERRLPLPGGGYKQKTPGQKFGGGNNWDPYRDTNYVVEVEDDPNTEGIDERFEVGFLLISRFETENRAVEYFDFKTLDELRSEFNANAGRAHLAQIGMIYTATVPAWFRNHGLTCGQGIFRHFAIVEFIGPDTEWD